MRRRWQPKSAGWDEVLIPREPGTFSAYGIMFSDLSHHLVRSRLVRAEAANIEILWQRASANCGGRLTASLDEDQVPADRPSSRFPPISGILGQAFELSVIWEDLKTVASG